MEKYNIEKHVQNDLNEKKQRYNERKEKLEVLNASKFEKRKYIKGLIASFSLLTSSAILAFVAANGVVFSPIIPVVNVLVSSLVGEIVETVLFNKEYGKKYDFINEDTKYKEQQELYLSEKVEEALASCKIAEKKHEYTLTDDFKKRKTIKDTNEFSNRTKDSLVSELKDINAKIVFDKMLKKYRNPKNEYIKYSLITVIDSIPLLLSAILSQYACGLTPTLLTSLVPFTAGLIGYGSHNIGLVNIRKKLYEKAKKRDYTFDINSDENLDEYQERVIKSIANKEIKEEYEKEKSSYKSVDTSKFVKRQIVKEDDRFYQSIADEIFDNNNIEVSIGENSKARILRKKSNPTSK